MLTRWLTVTALLAASASPERAAAGQGNLTVAPTVRVKGHPGDEALTLHCGDRKNTGVVQYWHTPFGDLQTTSVHSELDPVYMHHDGHLVLPNPSSLHGGVYHCLHQLPDGSTLFLYELHVDANNPKHQEHGSSRFRIRRELRSTEQDGVSDGQFAGAVAASVILTFVLGFSAGALSRKHVLRCLEAVTNRLPSPRRKQSDQPDQSSVPMTNLPPMYDNQVFDMEQGGDEDSGSCATTERTSSSTMSVPPAKPQRSFRGKRHEETTNYLEGCDHRREEEKRVEILGGGLDEKWEEEGQEMGEFGVFDALGEDDTKTDEDKCSEDGGKKDVEVEWDGEVEGDVEVEGDGEETRREEDTRVNKVTLRDGTMEEEVEDVREKMSSEEDGGTDSSSESSNDEETGCEEHEDRLKDVIKEGGEPSSSPPLKGRRSRVIRLYQYDEDGERYCHLPNPGQDEPGPAPRLKQRSASLTRLNAIMAVASAGPLDAPGRETGSEEGKGRPTFHMEI